MNDVNFLAEGLAEERESWKTDHEEAMNCRDLEEHILRGIMFFHVIRQMDQSWTRKVQNGIVKFSAERAREIRSAYEWWLAPCDQILDRIAKMEDALFAVEHAGAFRKYHLFARKILNLSLDDVIESFAQIERGEVALLTDEDWGCIQ